MKIIITLFLVWIISDIIGQTNNFAPVGAKWWYNSAEGNCLTYPDCGYITLESIGDTIAGDKICRILYERHFEADNATPDTSYIIYEDNGKVYFRKNESFYLLYDFDAVKDDTIKVIDADFTGYYPFYNTIYNQFSYIIDSVSTENIDGTELRVQYPLNISTGWGFGQEKIIEKIGSTILFFGMPNIIYPEFSAYLRCYEDGEIFYKNYGNECDYFTGIHDNILHYGISVGPNPASGSLFIINKSNENYLYKIFNSLGEELIEGIIYPHTSIDKNLSEYHNGIYYLQFQSKATFFTNPIIKI